MLAFRSLYEALRKMINTPSVILWGALFFFFAQLFAMEGLVSFSTKSFTLWEMIHSNGIGDLISFLPFGTPFLSRLMPWVRWGLLGLGMLKVLNLLSLSFFNAGAFTLAKAEDDDFSETPIRTLFQAFQPRLSSILSLVLLQQVIRLVLSTLSRIPWSPTPTFDRILSFGVMGFNSLVVLPIFDFSLVITILQEKPPFDSIKAAARFYRQNFFGYLLFIVISSQVFAVWGKTIATIFQVSSGSFIAFFKSAVITIDPFVFFAQGFSFSTPLHPAFPIINFIRLFLISFPPNLISSLMTFNFYQLKGEPDAELVSTTLTNPPDIKPVEE